MSSLKRLLNDVEDENPYPYADPSSISPYGSISGSSYHSFDDYSGNHPRQTPFQAPDYPQEAPVLEDHSSMGDVVNRILFDYNAGDQLANLNIGDGTEDVSYNLDLMLEQWSQVIATPSPGSGAYASPQPSPSGSGSSHDSLPVTHSPSQVPESSVTGSDSCSSAGDDEVDKVDKVCYGMLYNVDVKLIGDMGVPDNKLRNAHQAAVAAGTTPGRKTYQHFALSEQQDHILLSFTDDNTDFGYLRSALGKALSRLLNQPSVEFEAVAPTVDLIETIGRAKKAAEAMVKVDINVYGLRNDAQGVGDKLSEGKLWLQEPSYKREDVPYENPHFLHIDGACPIQMDDVRNKNGQPRRQPREDNLRKMMLEVYDSLKNNRPLDRVDGGNGLRRELKEHQKEALAFMLQRESGHIDERYRLWEPAWIDGQKWYRHAITHTKMRTRPEEKGGGILADEMGMGKSLSILSLVVNTLESGQAWAEQENTSGERSKDISYSGSTLVVVSSALLINNWLNEVKKHVRGRLETIKYHGTGRQKDPEKIKNSHIVVTTYNTLSAEYEKKTSVLHKIGWYRVVLDEAHIIRRPATTFYQACRTLYANSRWCLTGTPIQNKLSDIGALFAFIRAKPFDETATFRRYIEVPFEQYSDDPQKPQKVKDRLILLMQSLCLRRTKELLQLPGLKQQVKYLNFSPEERMQYDKTQKILMRTIKQKVGEVEKSSKFGLFQANLQLRILCNHGTYQKPFSWHRRAYREEREAAVSALGQDAEITCDGCHQPMPILGSSRLCDEFEEQCNHVFCSECLDESDLSSGSGSHRRHCPVCDNWRRNITSQRTLAPGVPLVRVDRPGVPGDVHMSDASAQSVSEDEDYFSPTGHSTKMEALVRDVQENIGENKSIIFSCWTRTLQLVHTHLERAGIPHLQIDGNCPLPKRQEMLDEFAVTEDTRVLIMTTGTGAFGLNLTCANRVFIVELQWNPSVENQAIARAIRLGQDRRVFVTRYVINGTVEVEMRSQQDVKKNLAAIGFDKNPYDVDDMDQSCD